MCQERISRFVAVSRSQLWQQRKSVSNPNTMKSPIEKIDINKKYALFSEYWRPKVVAELNAIDLIKRSS
jgi:hypothetical protein